MRRPQGQRRPLALGDVESDVAVRHDVLDPPEGEAVPLDLPGRVPLEVGVAAIVVVVADEHDGRQRAVVVVDLEAMDARRCGPLRVDDLAGDQRRPLRLEQVGLREPAQAGEDVLDRAAGVAVDEEAVVAVAPAGRLVAVAVGVVLGDRARDGRLAGPPAVAAAERNQRGPEVGVAAAAGDQRAHAGAAVAYRARTPGSMKSTRTQVAVEQAQPGRHSS